MSRIRSAWRWSCYVLPHVIRRQVVFGFCPICEHRSVFCMEGEWLRDQLKCARCRSIPRWCAIVRVLETFFPGCRQMAIHESSPGGSSSAKLARECRGCVQTHWHPDVPAGSVKDGYRSENLEQQTFPDASFDMVITQDVFEHVLNPARGFAEVARTLKPGGTHVFTVPWYYWKPTLVRAVRQPDGTVRHLAEPDYHGNPIDAKGSLVVTEWGVDLADFVYRCAGLTTTAVHLHDRRQGIEGKFIEVFISRKPEIGPAY